jgi:hypothetical protein
MSDAEYKKTDEDILVALRYLRLNLPAYATPENAIKLLKQMHGHYKSLEELHPEVVEEMLKDLEDH